MPKAGDIKENDNGKFIWRGTSDGGYWSQIEDENLVADRVPLACPSCNELIDNWSTSYYHKWGVCAHCYVDFLQGRQNLPEFKSNKERAIYCKEQKNAKNDK